MDNQIRVLVIDDEPLARQRLKNLLNDIHAIKLEGVCKTGEEAVKKIDELEPDIIFLDIELKDMTGFDVLDKISTKKKPLVIFVTAYDEFALKAFDNFAFDYLLKPFKDERFFKSTSNALDYIKNNKPLYDEKLSELLSYLKGSSNESKNNYKKNIPIRLGNKISFLKLSDIKYILASGYYAEIYTDDKKHLMRESLTKLSTELDPTNFVRVHRSTIINLKFVHELINSNFGDMDVKMKDQKLFRISKSYKKDFLNKMGV